MKMKLAALGVVALALTGAGVLALLRSSSGVSSSPAPEKRKLRVCADPNNLPFSNQKQEGFENRIAEVLARDLGAELQYTWWAQRRGHIRNTLGAGDCDLLIGVPASLDMVLPTAPYYRSGYVFVYRKEAGFRIDSLDSPLLKKLRIGVQIVGDDYANTPPAHALSRRGIVENIRGYSVIGDYSQPNPPARIIDAVAGGEIDVAIAWGPMAGYFARKQKVPLQVVAVSPQIDRPLLPFVFDISMGVRRGAQEFRKEIEQAIARNRAAVNRILDDYGVPRVSPEGT
jgi:quinoprotein dehydrogenase-associated probable ABC transporter substrate-binding protein